MDQQIYRYTEESYLALMDRFAAEGLPFSVAVLDMDWHLVDIDPAIGNGWTGYTWDPDLFPDPGRFLDALHSRGMQVTLNLHPAAGIRRHESGSDGNAVLFGSGDEFHRLPTTDVRQMDRQIQIGGQQDISHDLNEFVGPGG